MWVRASKLLSEAAMLHCLDDLLVHPDTLAEAGLQPGEMVARSFLGETVCHVGVREDVSPGVLFVSRRGVAGALSDLDAASLAGGQS